MRDNRLRQSIPNQLGKLFRVMARIYNRRLERFEVSSVQAHILATLWIEGPMLIGELQSRLMLGSSTLSGALARMEKVGLAKRVPLDDDRRAFRVEPVSWPAKKTDALLEELAATEDDIFKGLTAAERKELSRLLGKALATVQEPDDE